MNNEEAARAMCDRAETLVDDTVVLLSAFFRYAVISHAVNLMRNGKSDDEVRAELRKFNGFADYGWDEP